MLCLCPVVLEWLDRDKGQSALWYRISHPKKIITTRSAYRYDCRSIRDSVSLPPVYSRLHLHSIIKQPGERGNIAFISGKPNKGSGSGLSEGHRAPTALWSSVTGWRLPFAAPVTWKHLVIEFTMLISIMPQPHEALKAKDTKGICASDFWKVNNNLLPPICLVILNPGLCSEVWPKIANCKQTKESAQLMGYYPHLSLQQTKYVPRIYSLNFSLFLRQNWREGINTHMHTLYNSICIKL